MKFDDNFNLLSANGVDDASIQAFNNFETKYKEAYASEWVDKNSSTFYSFVYNAEYRKNTYIRHLSLGYAYFHTMFEQFEIDEEDAKIISKKLKNCDIHYEYMDNIRIALVGSEDQEVVYRARAMQGCCGFYDEIWDINGKQYMVGFNYGH